MFEINLVKTLHIVFVSSWFAGLFYLPRLFVNLAQEDHASAYARLLGMANRLFRFMTLIAVPALIFGIWLWLRAWLGTGAWIHAKLTLVLVILGYHIYCWQLLRQFRAGVNQRSHRWYRWFNEIPVFLMLLIVGLAVFKPF